LGALRVEHPNLCKHAGLVLRPHALAAKVEMVDSLVGLHRAADVLGLTAGKVLPPPVNPNLLANKCAEIRKAMLDAGLVVTPEEVLERLRRGGLHRASWQRTSSVARWIRRLRRAALECRTGAAQAGMRVAPWQASAEVVSMCSLSAWGEGS
jgi:hypothetical protein